MDTIIRFLTWTQITVASPEPYGWFHLAFFVFGMAAVLLLVHFLKRGGQKQHKIVFLSVSLFLIAMEIYKQLFFSFVMYDHYPWYIFPLQLCSTPMYLAFVVAFLKPSNLKTGLLGYMALYGLLGGLSVMLYPGDVFVTNLTISVQSMLWHLSLVFIGLYILATNQFGTKPKDFLKAFVTFVCMVTFVLLLNVVIYNIINPIGVAEPTTFNMFFISPYFTTTWPVFREVQQVNHWLYVGFYVAALTLGAYLFYFLNQKRYKRGSVFTQKPKQ